MFHDPKQAHFTGAAQTRSYNHSYDAKYFLFVRETAFSIIALFKKSAIDVTYHDHKLLKHHVEKYLSNCINKHVWS